LIDPLAANNQARPGDPWKFQPAAGATRPGLASSRRVAASDGPLPKPLDTTTIDVADAKGNLFSASPSPSSAWFSGGTFIAGDTGVPLGNRMQAFVLDEDHPNRLQEGKRPRTTLSPTIVLRDGKPFLALSSPGGDSHDGHGNSPGRRGSDAWHALRRRRRQAAALRRRLVRGWSGGNTAPHPPLSPDGGEG
jgi:gamma-glutamyltranspeptidase